MHDDKNFDHLFIPGGDVLGRPGGERLGDHPGRGDPKDQRFFSSPVIRAPYGSVLEEKGRSGLAARELPRREGRIHKSAVQEQKFEATSLASGRAQESSKDEIALAGKGFLPEVEKAFREKNPNMRYDQVNKVQNFNPDEQRIQSFIRAGGLKEPGGGS